MLSEEADARFDPVNGGGGLTLSVLVSRKTRTGVDDFAVNEKELRQKSRYFLVIF